MVEASERSSVAPQRRCPRRRRVHGDGTRQDWLSIHAARPAAECRLVGGSRGSGIQQSSAAGIHKIAFAHMHAFRRKGLTVRLLKYKKSASCDPYPKLVADTSPPDCLPRRNREPASVPDAVCMLRIMCSLGECDLAQEPRAGV